MLVPMGHQVTGLVTFEGPVEREKREAQGHSSGDPCHDRL